MPLGHVLAGGIGPADCTDMAYRDLHGRANLAVGAIVTAIFAVAAFRKQSAELTTLKEQGDDQRETNKKLADAAELQGQELRESLEERKQEQAQLHRAQAQKIYVTLEKVPATSAAPSNRVVHGRMARLPRRPAPIDNYGRL